MAVTILFAAGGFVLGVMFALWLDHILSPPPPFVDMFQSPSEREITRARVRLLRDVAREIETLRSDHPKRTMN